MFDPPLDAPPVLLALAIVATACVGLATAVAPAPPGDADGLAATVDRVAASPVATATTQRTATAALRVHAGFLETRDATGTDRAGFATGRITPVEPHTRLARVLHGDTPAAVFRSPVDLELAARRARTTPTDWHHEPDVLVVRRVIWGNTSVTLVGA